MLRPYAFSVIAEGTIGAGTLPMPKLHLINEAFFVHPTRHWNTCFCPIVLLRPGHTNQVLNRFAYLVLQSQLKAGNKKDGPESVSVCKHSL